MTFSSSSTPAGSTKRKRIDLTVEGFAKFAAGKPANVRLCLHHAIAGELEREQFGRLSSDLVSGSGCT